MNNQRHWKANWRQLKQRTRDWLKTARWVCLAKHDGNSNRSTNIGTQIDHCEAEGRAPNGSGCNQQQASRSWNETRWSKSVCFESKLYQRLRLTTLGDEKQTTRTWSMSKRDRQSEKQAENSTRQTWSSESSNGKSGTMVISIWWTKCLESTSGTRSAKSTATVTKWECNTQTIDPTTPASKKARYESVNCERTQAYCKSKKRVQSVEDENATQKQSVQQLTQVSCDREQQPGGQESTMTLFFLATASRERCERTTCPRRPTTDSSKTQSQWHNDASISDSHHKRKQDINDEQRKTQQVRSSGSWDYVLT